MCIGFRWFLVGSGRAGSSLDVRWVPLAAVSVWLVVSVDACPFIGLLVLSDAAVVENWHGSMLFSEFWIASLGPSRASISLAFRWPAIDSSGWLLCSMGAVRGSLVCNRPTLIGGWLSSVSFFSFGLGGLSSSGVGSRTISGLSFVDGGCLGVLTVGSCCWCCGWCLDLLLVSFWLS